MEKGLGISSRLYEKPLRKSFYTHLTCSQQYRSMAVPIK